MSARSLAALLAIALSAACRAEGPPQGAPEHPPERSTAEAAAPKSGGDAPAPKSGGEAPAPQSAGGPATPHATRPAPSPPHPLACPDGTSRWHARGVTELEVRGVGALKGPRPPADHFAYVCEGGRLARIERRDGSGALEGEDGGPAVELYREATATHVLVERLDAAGRPLGLVTLSAGPGDGWTRTDPSGVELLTVRDGLVVERRAQDAEGRPTTPWGGAAHAVVLRRSSTGAVLEQRWVGLDGAPVPGPQGLWSVRTAHNPADMPVEVSYHDATGTPMADLTGASVLVTERDFAGNALRTTRLGPTRAPAPTTDGVVTTRTERDAQGHAVLEETLDGGGSPVATFRGIARTVLAVDTQGRLVRKAWVGLDGQPVTDGSGIAAYGWDYTDDAVNGRARFFLPDGTEVTRHGSPLPR